jgi:hypothetical protein
MWGTSCESLKRDNDYLRDELEREREAQRRRDDDEYERRQRARREREAAREEELHYADTWTEAFSKGLVLFGREAREEEKCEKEFASEGSEWVGTYFRDAVRVTSRAKGLYHEEMSAVQDQIADIRRQADEQIAAIEQIVREKVAAVLDAEFEGVQQSISQDLRDNEPGNLVAW